MDRLATKENSALRRQVILKWGKDLDMYSLDRSKLEDKMVTRLEKLHSLFLEELREIE